MMSNGCAKALPSRVAEAASRAKGRSDQRVIIVRGQNSGWEKKKSAGMRAQSNASRGPVAGLPTGRLLCPVFLPGGTPGAEPMKILVNENIPNTFWNFGRWATTSRHSGDRARGLFDDELWPLGQTEQSTLVTADKVY